MNSVNLRDADLDSQTDTSEYRHRPVRNVSFEFFPPSDEAGADKLTRVASALAAYTPTFASVTYGAGGTTRDRTIGAIRRLLDLGIEVAGHLTCVASTPEVIDQVLDDYAAVGVRRVVALRGDQPEGSTAPPAFANATELVHAIRNRSDGSRWDISVAAYPEAHPRAESPSADLDVLKAKFDAGADRAITQFFFDADLYLRFRDAAGRIGISQPIVPGIMPISNFSRIADFAARCGASMPPWLRELLGDLDDTPEVRRMVAATVAAEQCRRLADRGVDEFHFYTMNQANLTSAICRLIGLRPNAESVRG